MMRRAILGVGAVALTLLAAVCIPRHLPTTTASSSLTPATFHASLEQGILTLRGSLPTVRRQFFSEPENSMEQRPVSWSISWRWIREWNLHPGPTMSPRFSPS